MIILAAHYSDIYIQSGYHRSSRTFFFLLHSQFKMTLEIYVFALDT